jgi:hypothetical protein
VTAEEIREALAEDQYSPFHGIDLRKPLPPPPGMPEMPPMPGMPEGGGQGMPGQGPPGQGDPNTPKSLQERGSNRPSFGAPMPQTMPRPPRPPTPGKPVYGRPQSIARNSAFPGLDIEEVEVIPLTATPIARPRG